MKLQPVSESLSDLVEHLELLGIRPDRVADRAGLLRLIATWGVAQPGGGVHMNGARTILARTTSEEFVVEAKRLMQARAVERAAARVAVADRLAADSRAAERAAARMVVAGRVSAPVALRDNQ